MIAIIMASCLARLAFGLHRRGWLLRRGWSNNKLKRVKKQGQGPNERGVCKDPEEQRVVKRTRFPVGSTTSLCCHSQDLIEITCKSQARCLFFAAIAVCWVNTWISMKPSSVIEFRNGSNVWCWCRWWWRCCSSCSLPFLRVANVQLARSSGAVCLKKTIPVTCSNYADL